MTPQKKLTDPAFLDILKKDPELRRLDRLTFDSGAEFALLLDVFGCRFGIGKLPVKPLTAAGWAMLWAIGNAFAANRAPAMSDVDIALYILSRDCRDLGCRPEELPARASGYALATELAPEAAAREIAAMIDAAFRPLAMIPAAVKDNAQPLFDADWAIRTAAIAARESNTSLDTALFEMPLSRVSLLFVSYLRRESPKGDKIRRQLPDENLRMIMDRVKFLQETYLKG